ncbi:MAG: hypothetical protein ACM33T_10285 [Solirubrobacterales bacterium]
MSGNAIDLRELEALVGRCRTLAENARSASQGLGEMLAQHNQGLPGHFHCASQIASVGTALLLCMGWLHKMIRVLAEDGDPVAVARAAELPPWQGLAGGRAALPQPVALLVAETTSLHAELTAFRLRVTVDDGACRTGTFG